MRSKNVLFERQQKKIAYSPNKVKDLLNDALEAIHYWQTECQTLERQILLIENENEVLRKKLKMVEATPPGVVRLLFGGVVK